MWNGPNALSSASSTLTNHLIHCPLVSQDVKTKALEKKKLNKSGKEGSAQGDSPQAMRFMAPPYIAMGGEPIRAPIFSASAGAQAFAQAGYSNPIAPVIPSISLDDPPAGPSSIRFQPYPRPAYQYSDSAEYPRPMLGPNQDNVSYISEPHSSSTSRASSLLPSDSASSVGVPSGPVRKGKQRQVQGFVSIPWTVEKKKRWERLIVELTASAGFPLLWVENPVWHMMLDEFIPEAPRTSRKVLTGRLLREVTAELREKVKGIVNGKDVTLQGDGWTGLNHHHLLVFMVTCEKQVCAHVFKLVPDP